MEYFSSFSIPFALVDVFTLGPIIILVGIMFYWSNREIKNSLERSKLIQELLSEDRDAIQEKLQTREKELADTRLARLNDLAKAAEFGRLSQGLFHDLIAPLTSVILHTEKLKENGAPSQHIERAFEASRRMTTYIKDMRATLQKEEALRDCNFTEELDVVLRFLAFSAREKNIELSILTSENISCHGSPTKIRQIFSNIISNAIDSYDSHFFTHTKKVEISLSRNAQNSFIKIQDYGSGISETHLDKIFDPFFTTKAHNKGTGIGLTTVKSIVEQHLRGTLSVESVEKIGTTITIQVPRYSRDLDACHLPPHKAPDLV